jgi:hypothetical protein
MLQHLGLSSAPRRASAAADTVQDRSASVFAGAAAAAAVGASVLVVHPHVRAGFGAQIHRYVDDDVSVITLTNLGEVGMGTLIALDVAKQYIPPMSLKAVKTGVPIDSALKKNIDSALRGRFDVTVDEALFTSALARSLGTERSKSSASRLKNYAHLSEVRVVKREHDDGKDTYSVIDATPRR